VSKKDVLPEADLWRLRGKVSNTVSEVKVFATRSGLKVAQDIFQACGARAGMAEEDLDRFWRDIRQLTLHDPVDYKLRAVGEFYLQEKMPVPGFRS
jgi:alkylation response protein AidB-like acyl-CoA dehydrogenase